MNAVDTILNLTEKREMVLVQSPDWFQKLAEAVNDLLIHDFNGLVQILYRLDVSESKIRESISMNKGEDAAKLIATLLLERQIEKIKTRQSYSTKKPDENDELHW